MALSKEEKLLSKEEHIRADEMKKAKIWGSYSWNFDIYKDSKNEKGKRELFEEFFVIDPVIFHIELIQHGTDNWDIQLEARNRLRLKQNVNISFFFDMEFQIIRFNSSRGYVSKYYVDASKADLAKDIHLRTVCGDWNSSLFSKQKLDRVFWWANPDQNEKAKVDFTMIIQDCIYDDEPVMKVKKMREILGPYIWSKEEMIGDLRKDKNELQKENDALKKQLQELKEKMESKENENNDQEAENKKKEAFNIDKWLNEAVHLGLYCDTLVDAGFDDLESIKGLTKDDLKEIGIAKLGHIKKILKAVEQLK